MFGRSGSALVIWSADGGTYRVLPPAPVALNLGGFLGFPGVLGSDRGRVRAVTAAGGVELHGPASGWSDATGTVAGFGDASVKSIRGTTRPACPAARPSRRAGTGTSPRRSPTRRR